MRKWILLICEFIVLLLGLFAWIFGLINHLIAGSFIGLTIAIISGIVIYGKLKQSTRNNRNSEIK